MKTIQILKSTLLCVSMVCTLWACEDAKNGAIDNLVYINEAASAKTKSLTMLEEVNRTSITVRLAQATTVDVKATLKLDAAVLEAYNKKNETTFKVPTEDYVTFEKEVLIKAGSISAEPIDIAITSFPTEGARFAVPISIETVEGVSKAATSSSFIIELVNPLRQQCPKFKWQNGMKVNPQDPWDMELTNYTVEWWCRITGMYSEDGGYSINNQAIIDSGGGPQYDGSEMYIRFGDLIYSEGGRYKNNFLQIKTMGGQMDTGDPTKGKGLVSGEWYHFALTYDAATGLSTMYKNGEAVATYSCSAGSKMVINKFQMISSGSQYFRDYCEMCQVRLWKVTRSANQIKKNMYSEVEYKHPDLIFYLPMNEGPGNTVLEDVTGNGHDVTIGNLNPSNPDHSNVTWEEYLFVQ